MIFRFIPKTLGGHVHIAVFCMREADRTFEKMGDLVVRDGDEWAMPRTLLVQVCGGDQRPEGSIDIEIKS